MSAFPDEPDHFVRWLALNGRTANPASFVKRKLYGRYLRELLEAALADAPDRLAVVQGAVADIELSGTGVRLRVHAQAAITADRAVLAVGNLPPHAPAGLTPPVASSPFYIADPWACSSTRVAAGDQDVLILGTGLTMVDMVLRLLAENFTGRITALSRRGLSPHAHDEQASFAAIRERPSGELSAISRDVRVRAKEVGWRNAIDELRPFTQDIWRAASESQRERFLRHLRPWWDVHRHRIAPSIAKRLDALATAGRLEVVAAKCEAFALLGDGVAVTFRRRSHDRFETRVFQRVINCTGPQGDLARSTDELLSMLSRRGVLRPDEAQLGIDVDEKNRVIGKDGRSSDRLLAVGPMTRGSFWEIVAVPDIRLQTWTLARRLSNAHWVGGEGL